LAWLLWGGVHIAFLVSFRARVFVLLNWVWSYLFFSKSARLITGPLPAAASEETAPASPRRPFPSP
jgi:NADH:ubiquinone reductase (H+-translocating)